MPVRYGIHTFSHSGGFAQPPAEGDHHGPEGGGVLVLAKLGADLDGIEVGVGPLGCPGAVARCPWGSGRSAAAAGVSRGGPGPRRCGRRAGGAFAGIPPGSSGPTGSRSAECRRWQWPGEWAIDLMVDFDIYRFTRRYSQVAILFHFAVLQCRSSCNFGGSVKPGGSAAAGMFDRHQAEPEVACLPADRQAPPSRDLCEAQ